MRTTLNERLVHVHKPAIPRLARSEITLKPVKAEFDINLIEDLDLLKAFGELCAVVDAYGGWSIPAATAFTPSATAASPSASWSETALLA